MFSFSGYATSKHMESLEPTTEYCYRLCVINAGNERSDYCDIISVKTTSGTSFFLHPIRK
jgi:hypothetical protein